MQRLELVELVDYSSILGFEPVLLSLAGALGFFDVLLGIQKEGEIENRT